MKTQPLPKPSMIAPEFSIADEVLFALQGASSARRMLLSTAIPLMSQCVMAGLGFELRSLGQDRLVSLKGSTLTGNPALLAAVADVEPLIRDLVNESRAAAFAEFNAHLAKVSTVSSP